MFALTFLAATLLATAVKCLSDGDSLSNLRPKNISELAYFYYSWTGSYYNGTTTIRIQPTDYDEDSECDTFTDGEDVVIEYGNSILGIVEPNRYYDYPHDFELIWTYFDKTTNITPTDLGNSNSPVNDVEQLMSVPEIDSSFDEGESPYWIYNATLINDVSYSFSGFINNTDFGTSVPIRFNYSSCANETLVPWGGAFMSPSDDYHEIGNVRFPKIRGNFNNNNARLEITGKFWGNAADGVRETYKQSTLGGPITITFSGTIDRDRSDDLIPTYNDTPRWNHTLGYSKLLADENKGFKSVRVGGTWFSSWVVATVLVWVAL